MFFGENVIYFDNAATSWPKPKKYLKAVTEFAAKHAGNPGRSAHRMSVRAARIIEDARLKLATLFSIKDPSRIVFTKNATEALNLAINGYLFPGDHVVTTSMEHNSVMRPLRYLESRGLSVTTCRCDSEGFLDIMEFERILRKNEIKLAIVCHASNVTGTIQDTQEITALCKKYNTKIMIDASQSAGIIDIDVEEMNIDLLAFTGHKGLLGSQGTGGLYISPGLMVSPLIRGGTGSKSDSEIQPDFLPDLYESGTANAIGLAGLSSSLDFIMEHRSLIRKKEQYLMDRFINEITNIDKIRIYGPRDVAKTTAVVYFNLLGMDP
jgi:cysteine desulfurase/selenocysteine lyase